MVAIAEAIELLGKWLTASQAGPHQALAAEKFYRDAQQLLKEYGVTI
jgi:hypothetical protein